MDRVNYESIVIKDLLDSYSREELDISPWYQRRSVWSTAHKAYLLNTIFEDMPIPTLYIRHKINIETEKTIKEVVDGQQRVRSILEFRNGEFSARHPDHAKRVRYDDLPPKQREKFLMTSLPVGYLIGASDPDVIQVFGRLNAVSKTLNPQEKRSARFSGEFHQFCLRRAAELLPIWRTLGIFTATQISRMLEVQFVAELSMALVDGIGDYSAKRIDDAYQRWDDDFDAQTMVDEQLDQVMALIAECETTAISDTIFRRHPVFYSLVLSLVEAKELPSVRDLETALHRIDERFNDDRPASERPAADVEFTKACTSSTQRIKSRKTRSKYIGKFIAH